MAASSLSSSDLFNVSGKVVLVTGGGRGIGKMIASAFVQSGARVYIASRSAAACEATAKELDASGRGSCIGLQADLSSEAGCNNLAKELASREAKLHVLVNNSGTLWSAPLEEYPDSAWDKLLALNLKAVFHLTRACIKLLDAASTETDPGRVINIGSITGIAVQSLTPSYAYGVSKAAVHHLSRKLATELADRRDAGGHSITVNAIAPGLVPSKMTKAVVTNDSILSSFQQSIPLRRIGAAADMGGAALFLASRAGAWITGVVLPVDGGVIAAPRANL